MPESSAKVNQDRKLTIYSPSVGDLLFYQECPTTRIQRKGVDDAIEKIIIEYGAEVIGKPLVFPYVNNWAKIAGDVRNHGLGVIVLLENKLENPLSGLDESNIEKWLVDYFGLAYSHKIVGIGCGGLGKRLHLELFNIDEDYQKLVDFLLNPKYEGLGPGLKGNPFFVNLDSERFKKAMVPKIESEGYKVNVKHF